MSSHEDFIFDYAFEQARKSNLRLRECAIIALDTLDCWKKQRLREGVRGGDLTKYVRKAINAKLKLKGEPQNA